MIGDGWDGEPSVRPAHEPDEAPRLRRVAVVTGSRADFGLLRPVMKAVEAHPELELLTIAAGAHLIQPALTFRDVKAEFTVTDSIPMQVAGRSGRADDVQAVGVGIARFGRSFTALQPDWVVVLGDRIEALAAAVAASIGGWALAHIHGGDRAEGVSDESIRHAVSKLAHLHLAATDVSADRLRRMGERPDHVHTVGSPAIDDLASISPLSDTDYAELGEPEVVVLMHPIGRHAEEEELAASNALGALSGRRVLALLPNHDPGRAGIVRAIRHADLPWREHLPRPIFVGLLKRLSAGQGLLVGNSSAGLIEAAALRLPVVDIGDRQAGRERPGNVIHAEGESVEAVRAAVAACQSIHRGAITHPYGDGRAGERIARLLAATDPRDNRLLRKRNAY